MKILEFLIESAFFLKIFISPVVFGAIITFFVVMSVNNMYGNMLGLFVMIASIMVGLLWAKKTRREYGSSTFYSKVNASPDLDKLN